MTVLEKIQAQMIKKHGNSELFENIMISMESEISGAFTRRKRGRIRSMRDLIEGLVRVNRIDIIQNVLIFLGDRDLELELECEVNKLDQISEDNEYSRSNSLKTL